MPFLSDAGACRARLRIALALIEKLDRKAL